MAASATDNVGVSKVDLLINGTIVASSTTAPYTFSWDSTKVANGTVTLSAIAYDGVGKRHRERNLYGLQRFLHRYPSPFRCDQFAWASSTVNGVVSVAASATDNVGVAKVNLLINGTLVASTTTAPYAFGWDSRRHGEGVRQAFAIFAWAK